MASATEELISKFYVILTHFNFSSLMWLINPLSDLNPFLKTKEYPFRNLCICTLNYLHNQRTYLQREKQ